MTAAQASFPPPTFADHSHQATVYTARDVARLHRISLLRRLGFPLEQDARQDPANMRRGHGPGG